MGQLESPLLRLKAAKEAGVVENSFDGSWSSLTEAGEATNLNVCHMGGLLPAVFELCDVWLRV